MADETIKIYDPSLDEMRAPTQADIDLLWTVAQTYGALNDILRDLSYAMTLMPVDERLAWLRDYRCKAKTNV